MKEGRKDGQKDLLSAWIQAQANRDALVLDEDVDNALVQQAVTNGYAPDLTDDELEIVGRDPFLPAYALVQPPNRCIVTAEVSKPSRQRQNRQLPDVCNSLGLAWCDTFAFTRTLGFKTGWKK